MAALVDEAYMRSTFKIHKDVGAGRITPYIAIASRRLKKWVGETSYADSSLAEILKLAEGTLVMHFLIRNLNTAIRPNGLVATESVEGNVTLRYLNPSETTQTETAYLEQAEELIRDIINYTPEDGIEIIYTENQQPIGDTWGEWQT